MATQLKQTDFAFQVPVARPNIRVAFSAGAAALAVRGAKLPDVMLDDLTFRDEANALIAKAADLLSPRMYDAFLLWAEMAVYSNTRVDDDEAARRAVVNCLATRRLADTDAQNDQDTLLKAFVFALEASDSPAFGPLKPDTRTDYTSDKLALGLTGDLEWSSPIASMVNALSARAWGASEASYAYAPIIGDIISAAFRDARAGVSVPATVSGYDRYMRGPLIQWQREYGHYEQAAADLATFDRDVHTSAVSMWEDLGARLAAGDTNPSLKAEYDTASADLDIAQDRFDVLVAARADAIDALLLLTAPGPSELAVKLQLYSEAYGWEICSDRRIGQRITTDARRFARHGAFTQSDDALLAAFAARRREFEAGEGVEMTGEQGDAYLDRLDEHEAVLHGTRATTIEGVLTKMRVAFLHQTGAAWSDFAASDTSRPEFREGLRLAGFYDQLAWSAIEDLARIGGVSLPEQGR